MKKLLYTFALVAFGLVISCDKNEELFEAPALDQEIASDNMMSEDDILDLVNSILDGTYSTSKKGNANSTGKGSDYVRVLVFSDDSGKYLTLSDETNDDLCADSVSPFEMFFDNSAGDGSVLTVEAPEGTVQLSLKGSFAGFFSAGLNSISKTDSEGVRSSAQFNEGNVASFN